MNASEVITQLEAMIEEHGDCVVGICMGGATRTNGVCVNFNEAPPGTPGAPNGWRIIEVAAERD